MDFVNTAPTWLDASFVIFALLTVLALIFIAAGIQIVPDGKTRIVERLGRRHRVLTPGINVIVPLLDVVKRRGFDVATYVQNGKVRKELVDTRGNISMAEQRMDPDILALIARDNSEVFVDSVAYFRIIDPLRISYDVASFAETFISLVETTLRQEVGKLDGDSIITSREVLSENLRRVLQDAGFAWGIEVIRVEIEEIRFDENVTASLSEARRQELVRRAELVAAQKQADQEVLAAEGVKKAEILRAEGKRDAAIMLAEGDKRAQILRAEAQFEEEKLRAEAAFLLASREQEGQAQGFASITAALASNPEAVVALEALKAQRSVAESLGNSQNALIVPNEVAGLFGAAAAAIQGIGTMNASRQAAKPADVDGQDGSP